MIKKLLFILVLFSLKPFAAKAQNNYLVKVEVKGIKAIKGTIKLQMVDENNKDVYTKIENVTAKTQHFNIYVYVKGKYAINVFHDKNNNNKLDTNILGIPTEGWGCSNDARGVMGPPKFKDKLINIESDKTIIINLVHY